MLRKVLIQTGIVLLFLLLAAYFFCAYTLKQRGHEKVICTAIEVTILDSAVNRFVSKDEVRQLITGSDMDPTGKNLYRVNLHKLERRLEKQSAILKSDIHFTREGTLDVAITQRRPILRLETPGGGFYVDNSGYVFPLVRTFTSFVPVVTGNIPLDLKASYRGRPGGTNREWIEKILDLAIHVNENEFWNSQIEQIDIEKNGDITIFTRIGDQTIYFGPLNDIDYKFAKLMAYYQEIVPVYGWEKYSEVNLKFSDQIVCTRRKIKKQN